MSNSHQLLDISTDTSATQLIQPESVLAGVLILAGGFSTRMGTPKALLQLPNGETLLDYHVKHASKLNVPIFIADNEQGFSPNESSISKRNDNQLSEIFMIADYLTNDNVTDDKTNKSTLTNSTKPKHSAGPLGAIAAGMQHALTYKQKDLNSRQERLKSDRFTKKSKHYDCTANWLMVISCDSLVTSTDIWSQLLSDKSYVINHKQITSKFDKQRTLNQFNQVNTQVHCLQDDERLYPLLGIYNLSLTNNLQCYLDEGNRRVMRFIEPFCQPITMPKSWYGLSNLNTPESFKQACQRFALQKELD